MQQKQNELNSSTKNNKICKWREQNSGNETTEIYNLN